MLVRFIYKEGGSTDLFVMAWKSGYFIFFYIFQTLQMNHVSFMAFHLNAVLLTH